MAILIPAIGSCASRMTSGERRLAERLEQKLDDDYLLWYDVPVGPRHLHPDFVVMHPRRGLLILEVKDWSPRTIQRADKQSWQVFMDGTLKTLPNPAEQARQYAHAVADALKRDPQLVHASGPHQGGLCFPWSYGVVFPNMTRKQFTEGQLDQLMAPHQVICSDEMLEKVDAEDLQSRLWGMFPFMMRGVMSLPQLDRVRWIMFPEVRVQTQGALFNDSDAEAELPSIMRVMDLQQEQLARSLGDGHRVIHGVAGSGKTMILGYRAEYLARAHTAASKPILILCYNEPLAVKLASVMQAKGLSALVHARHFHKWCRDQLVAFGQTLPAQNMLVGPKMEEMVLRVIHGVDRKHIPSGQYQAVLIDEGHDFQPEWLRLVTQMVDPATNSLLVLYDDAQSIYERARSKQFSFKSVGIQAQGRTTILKINYRNTRQILQTASLIAADLLTADDKDDDGIPLLKPISCGRDGQAPLIIRLPTLRDEAAKVAELLNAAHQEGHAWGDMAVICRRYDEMDECAHALNRARLPHQVRKGAGSFHPNEDTIKVLTMHASKGLEFPVVALVGVGQMLVVTDRNDLDDQLFDTFAASKQLLRQEPMQAKDREHLKALLKVAAGGVVFSTIQKFQPDEGNVYDQLSNRSNIVVIVDEAHRTQYGFAAKTIDEKNADGVVIGKKVVYGFAKYLRDALPRATYLGFTGTPIEKTDVNTPAVFGNYVDIYDIAQAVEDGATVRIYYESRLAKVSLSEEGKKLIAELDEELEQDELTETQKAKAKWTKMEALIGSDDCE